MRGKECLGSCEFRERRAFPKTLSDDVIAVVQAISEDRSCQMHELSEVAFQGESLKIPHRVSYGGSAILECAELQGDQGVIALCIGSQHRDGFLRETCLKRLLPMQETWVMPYVINLLGEYVLPIVQHIERALPEMDMRLLSEYQAANAGYFRKLESRAASCWDRYFRSQYPDWKDYPVCRIFAAIRSEGLRRGQVLSRTCPKKT